MKHSELRHQPRHVNPRIQDTWERVITTEISTGKPIAKLSKESDGTYWKSYGRIDAPKFKGEPYMWIDHIIDEPIQITKEEFIKLDIVGGSHFTQRSYKTYR